MAAHPLATTPFSLFTMKTVQVATATYPCPQRKEPKVEF
jgi:hypothetical protein